MEFPDPLSFVRRPWISVHSAPSIDSLLHIFSVYMFGKRRAMMFYFVGVSFDVVLRYRFSYLPVLWMFWRRCSSGKGPSSLFASFRTHCLFFFVSVKILKRPCIYLIAPWIVQQSIYRHVEALFSTLFHQQISVSISHSSTIIGLGNIGRRRTPGRQFPFVLCYSVGWNL